MLAKKFAIALILGAAAVEAQSYRPYRRFGPRRPTGPSGPSSRFGDKDGKQEEKENFELNLEFEAYPEEN